MRQSVVNWGNKDEVRAYRKAYYQRRKKLKSLRENPVEVKPTEEESKPRKKTTVAVTTPSSGASHFKSAFEKVSTQEAVERVLDGVFDSVVEKGLNRPKVEVTNRADGVEVEITYFKGCRVVVGVGRDGIMFVMGKQYLSGTDIEILRALDQNCEAILKGTARVIYDGPFTKFSDDIDSIFEDF